MVRIAAVIFVSSALLGAAEVKLGKPLTLKQTTPIASLAAEPGKYVGKTVQAKGRVTEVCQKMGCWMNLADESGKLVRIKVTGRRDRLPQDGHRQERHRRGQIREARSV